MCWLTVLGAGTQYPFRALSLSLSQTHARTHTCSMHFYSQHSVHKTHRPLATTCITSSVKPQDITACGQSSVSHTKQIKITFDTEPQSIIYYNNNNSNMSLP